MERMYPKVYEYESKPTLDSKVFAESIRRQKDAGCSQYRYRKNTH